LRRFPQLAEHRLSFRPFSVFRYKECGNYVVLAAENYGLHDMLSEVCGQWPLTVYAVPRKDRHVVNNALVSAGLPIIARWLCEARTDTWLDSRHRIELEFNCDSGELVARNVARNVARHPRE
jgi:hypothetical protein